MNEPDSPYLVDVVARLLGLDVDSIVVERSAYSTSFPIDVLRVTTAGGEESTLIRKDVSWASLLPEARNAKPAFLHAVDREYWAYQHLLPHAPVGTAACFGSVALESTAGRWIFLELIDGTELYQLGDPDHWAAAARWAAELHTKFVGEAEALLADGAPLLVHDSSWLRRWADRALSSSVRDTVQGLRFLHARTSALAEMLASQPSTIVHGEYYASNIILELGKEAPRVCPIDWEMVAVAPPLVDLAALTAGDWDLGTRALIERAYCDVAGRPHDATFARDLDACRLAQCLQWLGWHPAWQPPDEHVRDWLAEALHLAERLEL